MTATLAERPTAPTAPPAGNGGAPARRAIVRWAWRMFRREWRRQAIILALLVVAIAATDIGLGVASNAGQLKADPTFGTGNTIATVSGSKSALATDIAVIRRRVGTIDVIEHQSLPVPGSVGSIDLRAEDPNGTYDRVMLRLDSGHYPVGPNEVAVTNSVAKTFGLHVGGVWSEGGRRLQVVGRVENPLDLTDAFALVAPGQIANPSQVSILASAGQSAFQSLNLPSGGVDVATRGTASKTANDAIILVLGSLGMVFVGLMAIAGFTVMAQRRMRSLGMLGALGATDRHVRLVMLANGAVVGATAAVSGTAVGLASWFALVPTVQHLADHRIDAFDLPWWALFTAMLLTLVTALAAAWWPARAVARVSVVAALSGRPPRPQPAHRFAALGAVLSGAGLVLLFFADQRRAAFIIGGTVATAIGLLFLAPLAIRVLALVGRRVPVAARLALRDLARYQARSGAALGAVTLAIGIAATIAISAAAAQTPVAAGNLPNNELMLYLTPAGPGSPVPPLSTAQRRLVTQRIAQLGSELGVRSVLPLEQAYDPSAGLVQMPTVGPRGIASAGPTSSAAGTGYMTVSLAEIQRAGRGESVSQMVTLYVATPAVLASYGIKPGQIAAATTVLSSRGDLASLQFFGFLIRTHDPILGAPQSRNDSAAPHPTVQVLQQLPAYTSAPSALVTQSGVQRLGLKELPTAWLVRTAKPLTADQISSAQRAAASAGLYVETRNQQKSLVPLRNWSTAVGILVALGVLGMTVGLIRSETANDLRTLAATGASSTTRRTVTGTTAGALGLLGGLLGTAGAYAALLAWHRSNLSPLSHVPVVDLVLIVLGLPAIAAVAGWLLAGREPPIIAKQPLE